MFQRFLQAVAVLTILAGSSIAGAADRDRSATVLPDPQVRRFLSGFCLDCHGATDPIAGVDLKSATSASIERNSELWEKVARKLRARQMPPSTAPRPEEPAYIDVLSSVETALDRLAQRHPQPGRTESLRRLTRTEYRNAVRDLLALDVDVDSLLPADESSHGFDNVTVGELSPTLLNRYIAAAQKISRLAIGRPLASPEGRTIRVRPDITQEERLEGLPFGTRGGTLISHTFPQQGEYEIRIRLARDRNEHVEGLREVHELDVLLDSERVASFKVTPPRGGKSADGYSKASHANVDRHLKARIRVTAGPHEIGVAFLKNPSSLLETRRQPLNVHFNMYRHPRLGPAVYQVSIVGPLSADGPGDTPSRRRVFVRRPSGPDDEENCARQIVSTLLRRACRRPIVDEDLREPMSLYRAARAGGSFEDGIEMALSSILVSPHFLFRIERDPADVAPSTPYRISNVELASRLSFFLWSSIPDDELLAVAERGELTDAETLRRQTLRMLADSRSGSLVTNFAGQWLYLRNLESITPDQRLYPDFDDNLRQAFREETEQFFESILREDRSVLDLLRADYTFLNERLARHYGIPHVYGSRFRRVSLKGDSQRGGLLRQGSILTVTSYATRTSPVIRGKWILENLLGTPPPPPPPNVPNLKDNTVSAKLSVRERLARHRANAACAGCHNLIDPVGFALENFDAVGRWRDVEAGRPVDSRGGLPDGTRFAGVFELENALLNRPEPFVGTMTEKLLTFALGRGVEHFDGPAIRRIVSRAKDDDYRFSSLILGIVSSNPFQMRTSE